MRSGNFLSVADLTAEEADKLLKRALDVKRKPMLQLLRDKILVLLFEKPSLRTRVSFEVGIRQLGGSCLYLSPDEVGLGKREPVVDVARVLSRYVNGIIARTFAHGTLQMLARYSTVPVINALSDLEHPCQALADVLTVREKKGKLKGLTLAYIGDGNNVAHSLLLATTLSGLNFKIASPAGYEVSKDIVDTARKFAVKSGSQIALTNHPFEAVKDADIVYTDVWTSMGQEAEAERRRKDFAGYQVDNKLLSLAKKDVIFMHPMPAHHGEEVAQGVLDGPHSVAFDQAENRLHLQKALLAEMFG
ncbi:MAG: ornithine carbamoyltransferase [Chloroflexi bacterium]|nr:ornithine carbamoyltransferase [Chloroflexota bacterium]MBM3173950.1 ornithine carbamoyltransferase [Chloroflexota bacterium]MBM3176203.1 ornithine carbamoyltransferase [Chloroflexota bacterium]MBM4450406.1 ornithine carbamoyltransferase [Chloroflexota bacterium]